MRIAHVTATFPPYFAGTGNVVLGQAQALARRGHEVHVFTGTPGGPVEGLQVHRLKALLRLGNAPLLPGLLRMGRFDVVHLHMPFIFGAELVRADVVTVHNELRASGVRGLLFGAYERLVTQRVLDKAKTICVVSKAHGDSMHSLQGRAFVEVPNGVDPAVFRPDAPPAPLRERFAIPADAPLALVVCSLDAAHWFKRVDHAIAAVAKTPAHLVVAGDGSLRAALQAQAGPRVHFAGRVPEAELPGYYTAADFFLLSSQAVESFGLVFAEAMASGKAVIAPDLPGPRELVGDAGLLFTPGDIADLARRIEELCDPASRAPLAARARERILQRYTWDAAAAQLEVIYRAAAR